MRVSLFLELLETEWGIFGLSLLVVGCFMWIAWIDSINQQTRNYLKFRSYETPLLLPTNFSRLGI
ncbi:hypothetical protein ECC46_02250 [Helicobacter pylori]|nr:hypothetical protein ECC46_02250 [Helicobacter pylori]